MMSQAGASDDPAATGTAARTSGPSAGYAGRIKARIKPNIVLTDDVAGNPLATVEVRLAPDGTIVGRKLVKSSGSPAWDEAVLRAIDRTEVLPRDIDGRVPPSIVDRLPAAGIERGRPLVARLRLARHGQRPSELLLEPDDVGREPAGDEADQLEAERLGFW